MAHLRSLPLLLQCLRRNCFAMVQVGLPCSTEVKTEVEVTGQQAKMSRAMQAYLERARAHDEFMKDKISEFEIGKRHLANMMGEDPETFTQDDINRSIAYLFPSGIFEPRARPIMRHPKDVFPKRKAAEFDEAGRPFDVLFYTAKPNYYHILQDVTGHHRGLNRVEDKMISYKLNPDPGQKLQLIGSDWLHKEDIEKLILEPIKDSQYENLVNSLKRLADHPYSYKVKDIIMRYRRIIPIKSMSDEIPELLYDGDGRPYMTSQGVRKRSKSQVTVKGQGSGQVKINGLDMILYFENIQERQMLMFPLQFTGFMHAVDVEATVEGLGVSCQAGAIRFGIANCLRSFVDKEMVEKMRLAGLLTNDPRKRERKKPGQEGARRKFTWKKR